MEKLECTYGMHMGLSVQNTCMGVFLQKVKLSLFKLQLETWEVQDWFSAVYLLSEASYCATFLQK